MTSTTTAWAAASADSPLAPITITRRAVGAGDPGYRFVIDLATL